MLFFSSEPSPPSINPHFYFSTTLQPYPSTDSYSYEEELSQPRPALDSFSPPPPPTKSLSMQTRPTGSFSPKTSTPPNLFTSPNFSVQLPDFADFSHRAPSPTQSFLQPRITLKTESPPKVRESPLSRPLTDFLGPLQPSTNSSTFISESSETSPVLNRPKGFFSLRKKYSFHNNRSFFSPSCLSLSRDSYDFHYL